MQRTAAISPAQWCTADGGVITAFAANRALFRWYCCSCNSKVAIRSSMLCKNWSLLTHGLSANMRNAVSATSGLLACRAQPLTSQYASNANRPSWSCLRAKCNSASKSSRTSWILRWLFMMHCSMSAPACFSLTKNRGRTLRRIEVANQRNAIMFQLVA